MMRLILRLSVSVALALGIVTSGWGPGMPFAQTSREGDLLRFAHDLYEEGRYDLAAQQFRELLEAHPRSTIAPEALMMLSNCLLTLEQYEAALDSLSSLRSKYPQSPFACEASYRIGQGYSLLGEDSLAVESYLYFLRRCGNAPQVPGALAALADTYLKMGDHGSALTYYRQIEEDYSDSPFAARALLGRGIAFQILGRDAEALASYESMASRYPESEVAPMAELRRASLLRGLSRLEEAESVYQSLRNQEDLSESANTQATYGHASVLRDQGRYQDAARVFQQVPDHFPDSPIADDALLGAAEAWANAPDLDRSAGALERLLEQYEDSDMTLGALQLLAEVRQQQSADTEALGILRRIEEEFPGMPASLARVRMAESLRRLGQPREAIAMYRQYVAETTDLQSRTQALFAVADIYEKDLEEPVQALRVYGDLVDLLTDDPRLPAARYGMARTLESLGRYQGAEEEYRLAAEEFAWSVWGEKSATRVEYVRRFLIRDELAAVEDLIGLAGQCASGKVRGERYKVEVAHILLHRLKDFEGAIEYLETYLEENSDDPEVDNVVFELGQVHESAALRANMAGQEELFREHRSSAAGYYSRLLKDYPGSRLADRCEVRLIELELSEEPDEHRRARRAVREFERFLSRYPESGEADYALKRLADAAYHLFEAGDQGSFEKAMTAYDLVLTRHAESDYAPQASYGRAVTLAASGDLEGARQAYARTISAYPLHEIAYSARLRIAESLIEEGRVAEALEALNTLANLPERGVHTCLALTEMGDLQQELGRHQDALASYRRVLDEFPGCRTEGRVSLRMAHVLALLGRHQEAHATLDELGDQAGGTLLQEVQLARVDLYLVEGDTLGALRALNRFVEEKPEPYLLTKARIQLVDLAFSRGNHWQVRETVQSLDLEDLAPEDAERMTRFIAASLFRLGQRRNAGQWMERYEEDFPRNQSGLLSLLLEKSNALLREDEHKDAREVLKRIETEFANLPEAKQATYGIGLAYLGERKYEEAAEVFQRLLAERPGGRLEADARFKLATSVFFMGDYEGALREYRAVVRSDAAEGAAARDAAFNIGLCYERLGLWGRAAEAYRELLASYPTHPQARRVMLKTGFTSIEAGEYRRAIDALKQIGVPESDEEGAEIQFWIGESYSGMGDAERAAVEFRKVSYLFPGEVDWAATADLRAGDEYEKLGRIQEAKDIYEQVKERYGKRSQWGKQANDRLNRLKQ